MAPAPAATPWRSARSRASRPLTDDRLGAFDDQVNDVVRAEHGRLVGALTRRFGDLDLAEDAVADAWVAALETWPTSGMPDSPGAWLMTAAQRKALDVVRREAKRATKQQAAWFSMPGPAGGAGHHDAHPSEDPALSEVIDPMTLSDDQLRLLFCCCHPALALPTRLALTLRLVGGLTVPEISRGLLTAESTIAQRISRAKQKIRATRIPFTVPGPDDVDERLDGVLTVLALIYNEGYLSSAGDQRVDLAQEALRLTRELAGLVDHREVDGLLALMMLSEARRPARFADGHLVLLADQDRSRWDRGLIRAGHDLVRQCLAANRPGRFQLQAAIQAVHTDAASSQETDWSQVVALYDHLMRVEPTPVVAMNRAIAVAERDGAEQGLSALATLDLTGYHPWWVAQTELLARLGRRDEARECLDRALALTMSDAERRHLEERRRSLGA